MKISNRLYLTVAPAGVAALLLAGLVYWGQYEHTAPEFVLVGATLAVIASAVLAWSNARYVVRRIERLASRAPTLEGKRAGATTDAGAEPGDEAEESPREDREAPRVSTGELAVVPEGVDELDEIERAVYRLSSAVEIAEMNRADREALFRRRVNDYALLLASTADACTGRIEEVRLPLHILLDNRFGELNENQEEMLGAARVAADAAHADLRLLRQIAAFDLGDHPLRRDPVKPKEIVEAIRPMLVAAAEAAQATIEVEVAPLLPTILVDRPLLQEAFVTLLRDTVSSASPQAVMRLDVERSDHDVVFTLRNGGSAPLTVRRASAIRIVQAHDGTVTRERGLLRIDLPTATLR